MLNLKNKNIKQRFLVIYFAMVVSISILTSGYYYIESCNYKKSGYVSKWKTITEILAQESKGMINGTKPGVYESLTTKLFAYDDPLYIIWGKDEKKVVQTYVKDQWNEERLLNRIINDEGCLIVGVEPVIRDPVNNNYVFQGVIKSSIGGTISPVKERKILGYVILGVSGRGLQLQLRENAITSITIFIITLGLGIVAIPLFGKTILQPIENLHKYIINKEINNLDPHDMDQSGDEIENIKNIFNLIASKLGESRGELVEINQVLEQKVKERTRNLEESYKKMKKTQEELAQSTQLVSVGEVVGRTAHEILNPVTGMFGRIDAMLSQKHCEWAKALEIARAIVNEWVKVYEKDGFEGLVEVFQKPVSGKYRDHDSKILLDEDLYVMQDIIKFLTKMETMQVYDLKFLLRELNRLIRIVESIKKMDKGPSLHYPVDIIEVVKESIEILQDSFQKRQVEISLECEKTDQLYINADRYEIIQVFTNIFRNAMQAIDKRNNGIPGKIVTSVVGDAQFVFIRIKDNGIGIKDELIEKIFQSGFTTKNSDEGAGLGLAICKRLVNTHYGTIKVEHTNLNNGTTFLVSFPRIVQSTVPRVSSVKDYHGK